MTGEVVFHDPTSEITLCERYKGVLSDVASPSIPGKTSTCVVITAMTSDAFGLTIKKASGGYRVFVVSRGPRSSSSLRSCSG